MEKSENLYEQLSSEERSTIMLMQQEGSVLREMGRFWDRSPCTILRELARGLGAESRNVVSLTGEQDGLLRSKPHKVFKLVAGSL